MEREYAATYRELYTHHWWWRARERVIVSTLRTLSRGRTWRTILDVGCGDGLFFDRLREFGDVEGVEPDASLVDPAGPWRSRIYVQPFDERFRPAHPYSLITMFDVLEHLPDAAGALRHASALLERGGMIVATVPAFESLWTSHDDINHHVQRFTKATLQRLLTDAGFAAASMRYFYFWTCPLKLLIRFKERALRRPSAVAHVPPAVINRALFALSVVEQETLGRLPVPFGSSLICVGRRFADEPDQHHREQH
jgi:SAM-dependent methyltransferase